MSRETNKRTRNPLVGVLLVLLSILLLIVFLPFLLAYVVWDLYLRMRFLCLFLRQGKFVLFVYSDSPNWKSHIETHLLPRIEKVALVLNWSERSRWENRSWPVQAFRHWGGTEEFNPLAIVWVGGGRIRTIRFYHPFRDFKHGNEAPLRQAESELTELVRAKARSAVQSPGA